MASVALPIDSPAWVSSACAAFHICPFAVTAAATAFSCRMRSTCACNSIAAYALLAIRLPSRLRRHRLDHALDLGLALRVGVEVGVLRELGLVGERLDVLVGVVDEREQTLCALLVDRAEVLPALHLRLDLIGGGRRLCRPLRPVAHLARIADERIAYRNHFSS